MKKILIITAALAFASPLLHAQLPTYVTQSTQQGAGGTTTNVFAYDAQKTIVVKGAVITGDSNTTTVVFRSGTTGYTLTQTNLVTGTNIVINTTNGLTSTDAVLLYKADGTYKVGTVFGVGSSTNLYLTTGGFGANGSIGDELFLLSSATTLPVGATTVSYQGEAIYVGTRGRPMVVTSGPALSTNRQASVTVRYE